MKEMEPLTLEELSRMDGKPVFVVPKGKREKDSDPQWCVVTVSEWSKEAEIPGIEYTAYEFKDYGENWVAYRMEPQDEGRVIILPCKVTDTVYLIEGCLGGENCVGKRKKFPLTDRVVSAQIDHVTIGGTTGKPVYDLCTETGGWFYSMEPGEFYLTREEAEQALEEGRKNSEF